MDIKTNKAKYLIFVGLLVMSTFVVHFVGAKDDHLSYFQDRDQDGLSDEEEKALGTDWQNPDTDGDGYSDGVEVAGGFDPLTPAPGDRLSKKEADKQKQIIQQPQKKPRKNLTREFIEKLKNRKKTALETFKEASKETGVVTDPDELNQIQKTSITKDDIAKLAKETLQEANINDELQLIDEKEFKILPKVIAKNNRKKKEKIKKQLEEYLAQTGYIMINSLPFRIKESDEFNKKLEKFMLGISDDIVLGSDLETKQAKNKLKEALDQLKEVEVPYVIKDMHIRSVSLLKYLLDQDEDVVFQKDDPIAMGLMVGKLQGIISEIQDTQLDLELILEKYGVGQDREEKPENSDKQQAINK